MSNFFIWQVFLKYQLNKNPVPSTGYITVKDTQGSSGCEGEATDVKDYEGSKMDKANVCVCVCVYIYTYIHVCIYTHTHTQWDTIQPKKKRERKKY